MQDVNGILAATAPLHTFFSSIMLSLTTALLMWWFRAKVKLIWGSTSANFHQFDVGVEADQRTRESVWTEKFYVQNVGKKPATNVEVILSGIPTSYNLWPPRQHEARALSDGTASLKIPSLAPSELLIVDVIDLDLKSIRLLAVNCPEAVSKAVKFLPMRDFGIGFKFIVWILLSSGLIGLIYIMLLLLGIVLP